MVKFLSCLLLAYFAFSAQAAEKQMTIAGRTVYEWPPTYSEYEKAPIIIFSHSFHGCGNEIAFLADVFSRKGFWVFAPNHADQLCNGYNSKKPPAKAEAKFTRPSDWNAETYAGRKEDIRAVRQALQNDSQRRNELDFNATGLMGYELGGYIALGMAGARPEWKTEWVSAVLALSPYTRPYNEVKSWSGFSVPLMFQGGAKDSYNRPDLTTPEFGAYAQATAPKYLIIVKNAHHYAWNGQDSRLNETITRYGLAFFQHYLTGQTSPLLTGGGQDVSRFAYQSKLGSHDTDSKAAALGKSGSSGNIRGNWRDRELKSLGSETQNEIP